MPAVSGDPWSWTSSAAHALPAIPELGDRCERDAEDDGVDEHRGRGRSEDECCGSGGRSCDERERLEAREDRVRGSELLLGNDSGDRGGEARVARGAARGEAEGEHHDEERRRGREERDR